MRSLLSRRVHRPLAHPQILRKSLAAIAPERFVRWHAGYTRSVTWIVAPLMLGQAALLGRLLLARPGTATAVAVGLVAVAWVATFIRAVPLHERLQAEGPDLELVGRLVAANWIRTIAWTLAFLLLLAA